VEKTIKDLIRNPDAERLRKQARRWWFVLWTAVSVLLLFFVILFLVSCKGDTSTSDLRNGIFIIR